MDYIQIYKTRMPNARKTLDSAVTLNEVYQRINNTILKEKFGKILSHKSLYFWDFGAKAVKELKNGMSVSIICGNKKYDCQLIEIIDDPEGELGNILGWARQFQAPWKNVCALKILNNGQITSGNIITIKRKTMSVTKSFFKVTDHELKNKIYLEGKSNDITKSPSQDGKDMVGMDLLTTEQRQPIYKKEKNRIKQTLKAVMKRIEILISDIVMFFKRMMHRDID